MNTWGCRQLKKEVLALLQKSDFDVAMQAIKQWPARQVVNPLISLLYHQEERIKWRAVIAMGIVVDQMADLHKESARIVMRRLMWSLNDESGGIGWGSPEVMGEIMARHKGLADEFHSILISYIRPDQNYIEHEILQRGVLWGIGRLSQIRPHLMRPAAVYLIPYMEADDPYLRGLAAWAARAIGGEATGEALHRLVQDEGPLAIFSDDAIIATRVKQLAAGDIS
jgi:hypothetical protein